MSRTTNFQACAILCKIERFMAGYIMLSVNPTLKCLTIICLSWCQRLFIWTIYYIRIEKVSTKEMISITIFYNSYHPKYYNTLIVFIYYHNNCLQYQLFINWFWNRKRNYRFNRKKYMSVHLNFHLVHTQNDKYFTLSKTANNQTMNFKQRVLCI